jgi:hypothetical protein
MYDEWLEETERLIDQLSFCLTRRIHSDAARRTRCQALLTSLCGKVIDKCPM